MNRLIFAFLAMLAACTPNEREGLTDTPDNLIGTWERVKWVDISISDTTWTDQDPNIIYLKHITPTHFTWLSYNTQTEELNSTGGGTYTYDKKNYIENIEFFHPAGTNLPGRVILFEVKFVEGIWHHTGRLQDTELDLELSEVVLADTILIDEMWKKAGPVNNNTELVGTWELVSRKNHEDSTRIEVPHFMRIYKLITPSHFNWIQVNRDDEEVFAEGGGTFTLSGDVYTENPLYHFPVQEAISGLTLPFSFKLDSNGYWIHKGTFMKPKLDTAGIEIGVDTVYIDEVWKKWETEN